jgi:hypothetical protein
MKLKVGLLSRLRAFIDIHVGFNDHVAGVPTPLTTLRATP